MQGSKTPMLQYTHHRMPRNAHQNEEISETLIDVSDDDQRASRWFAAMIAPQYGFRISVDFTDNDSP